MTKTHGKTDKDAFIRELVKARFSRRDFNKALSATGLAVATMPLIPRDASAQGEAIYFGWSGYEIPELQPSYIEKHGTTSDAVIFADENEGFQKVRAGFTPDVAHPCSPMTPQWREAGLIQPIDTSRLSNWPDVFPALKTMKDIRFEGEQWFVPFDWGRTSITYRTDLVDIEEESYGLLWDERYKGRMAVFDSVDETVFITAIYAGLDPCNMGDAELETVFGLLREQRPLLRFYAESETDITQAMAAGEVVAATTWDSGAAQLMAEGVPVRFMNPKEGVETWVCGLILLKDAPNPDKAYDLIDAMLDPSAGEFLIADYGIGHSNQASFDRVSDETLALMQLPRDPTELLHSGVMYCRFKNKDKVVQMFREMTAGF
ncbi:MAG: extracellular solute-binding protein [Alphaproteobacteria bacterium]